MTNRRLIEVAFPIKQASIDSVHEKNVRQGNISTLHIWPARRPLAASRAALIATLLPDLGTKEERDRLLLKLGGKVVIKTKKDGDDTKVVEETEGGILHWGNESSPDVDYFRQLIRKSYGGRSPRVLDPFSGGGSIPLEAMRLGCEVTANDLNPVAWFILKCTLEYPQRLTEIKRPLPLFALENPAFMAAHLKGAYDLKGKKLEKALQAVQLGMFPPEDAKLAWHVRAWSTWVFEQARKDLEPLYPIVDEKTSLAYLWARTVRCKNCRAEIPLLKTRWLCKRQNKRVLLTTTPNETRTGVIFGIQNDVPERGGNTAQRTAHDKVLGSGTMTKSGVTCPCCNHVMNSEYIRYEAMNLRFSAVMTAVVVDGKETKEYRLPTDNELILEAEAEKLLLEIYADIPFGIPNEQTPIGASRKGGGSAFNLRPYGIYQWHQMFTQRQLAFMGTLVRYTRNLHDPMEQEGYPPEWIEAVIAYIACGISKILDYGNTSCSWSISNEQITHLFNRFALPIKWDYVETSPFGGASGSYDSLFASLVRAIETLTVIPSDLVQPRIELSSAIDVKAQDIDVIVTDPPYYDAIPYADTMDFFYVWLRRVLWGLNETYNRAFANDLTPKWDHDTNNGELIDDAGRFGGDHVVSKQTYEDGMYRAFARAHEVLSPDGRIVIVFGHKAPDAWETLVSAVIRAGFVVDGSWPIRTEREARTRALSSAALSSSVWLVCRKRPETARPGWDHRVLEAMRANITVRLRDYWDAGIRGPDFVWAATGPAMEAYSQHPVVKKADEPGAVMGVEEFLGHVRRMVVDFMVGQVLSREGGETTGLDDVTTYYLLHRKDFGMGDAPASACILYALSCGLTDRALSDQYDILNRGSAPVEAEITDEDDEDSGEADESSEGGGSGSTVRLQAWGQRVKRKTLGYEAPGGRPAPLIDQAHRLLALWKVGDVVKVDQFLDEKGLRRSGVFSQLLQALIELASGEERALLESISNHFVARGASPSAVTTPMFSKTDD